MMNKCKILFLLLAASLPAYAETWEDPYFYDAVQQSALVCIANVVSTTDSTTVISIEKLYKGQEKLSTVTVFRAHPGAGHEKNTIPINRKFLFIGIGGIFDLYP